MTNFLKLTIKQMGQRKLRGWLTILGIVIGIGAIVALISLSQGMENALNEQFSRLGGNVVQVVPAQLRGPPTGDHGIDKKVIPVLERMKQIEYANPLVLDFATVEFNKEKAFLFVNGYDTGLSGKGFLDADINVEKGRLFAPGETGIAVVGHSVAEDTFDKEIRVKNSITLDNKKFRVIGVFESTGTPLDDRVYIALDDAEELFGRSDVVNAVAVKIKPNVDIETAKVRIQKEVEKVIDEEEFDLFTADQIQEQFNSILGVMQAVLVGIALISLIVGAIGIMNSMFTSVLERTREIGVMKAIGARNSDILSMFIIEAGLIGVVGGIIGAVGGAILAKLVGVIIVATGFTLLSVTIQPSLILGGLVFAFVVGVISGIVPAMRAAKLQPVEALRYE